MRRWMAALALLTTPAWAQDIEEQEIPEEEVIEEEVAEGEFALPAGQIVRGERDAPAVAVRLREPGVIQIRTGEEWKDATLDSFAWFLKAFAEEQEAELKKTGRSAYEVLPSGTKVSRLYVSLNVDPAVPWQHVQWLVQAAAEQKFHKVEMSDGERRLLVALPLDTGVRAAPKDRPKDVRLQVHAIARAEKEEKWGDVQVLRPTEIRYKIGAEEAADIATMADLMRKAKKAAEGTSARVVGEIQAGNKVPFSRVFDLMDAFERAGIANVNFRGTSVPKADLRAAARLPFPLKNYETVD